MKRAITLLMALTLALSMGAGAFAAEDPTAIPGDVDGGVAFSRGLTTDVLDSDYDYDISSRLSVISDTHIAFAKGEIFLVTGNRALLPSDLLEPNTEYEFDVYYAKDDITSWENTGDIVADNANFGPVMETDLNAVGSGTSVKLRLRSGKGTSTISSAKLTTTGVGTSKRYQVEIETRDQYLKKQTDVEYRFSISGSPATAILDEGTVAFKVGFGIMKDDDVDDYSEDDIVTISNDAPIWTKKQIERLVKAYNYKAIELEADDGTWTYEGRMNGMGDTNFYYTQDVIPAIMNKFDQDFKFLIFPAEVTFPTNGEMRIDVSDVSDDWDRMYTYLYRNGKLTRINTTYDGADDMIVFRTNYLGAFVMTDVEITDTDILGTDESSAPDESTSEPSPGTGNGGTNNPNTGIPVGLNLIVGLGSLSLLTAGSVIIRKKK